MTTQQLGSYLRQALAIVGVVFGVLTASVTQLHLPAAVSTVLVVGGSVILAVEHYVSDPSTGTTPAPTVPAPPVAAVPVAPAAVPASTSTTVQATVAAVRPSW